MKLEFKVGGEKVSNNDFGKAIEEAALANIQSQVKKRLESMACPVHGSHPSIKKIEKQGGKLNFAFNACCEEMLEKVKASFR